MLLGRSGEGDAMPARSIMLPLFATLATAAAVVFLAISIDPDVYAPGAGTLQRHLGTHGHLRHIEHRLPHAAQRALDPRTFLRKLYSVIAFAVVGFFAAPLVPRPSRLRYDAALIASFSLLVEIAQKLVGSNESYASNAFDIACGGVGGILGALAWNAVTRQRTLGSRKA